MEMRVPTSPTKWQRNALVFGGCKTMAVGQPRPRGFLQTSDMHLTLASLTHKGRLELDNAVANWALNRGT